jgi:tape measure domain-containing protein
MANIRVDIELNSDSALRKVQAISKEAYMVDKMFLQAKENIKVHAKSFSEAQEKIKAAADTLGKAYLANGQLFKGAVEDMSKASFEHFQKVMKNIKDIGAAREAANTKAIQDARAYTVAALKDLKAFAAAAVALENQRVNAYKQTSAIYKQEIEKRSRESFSEFQGLITQIKKTGAERLAEEKKITAQQEANQKKLLADLNTQTKYYQQENQKKIASDKAVFDNHIANLNIQARYYQQENARKVAAERQAQQERLNAMKAAAAKERAMLENHEAAVMARYKRMKQYRSDMEASARREMELTAAKQKQLMSMNFGVGPITSLSTALLALRGGFKEAYNAQNLFTAGLTGMITRVTMLATSLATLPGRAAQLASDFLGYRNALQVVAGTQEEASRQMAAARAIALDLRLDVGAVTKEYSKFTNALVLAKDDAGDAASAFEEARGVFYNFSVAARVLNLNSQKTSGMFLALEQMVSKSTVSMEELRRQLGEYVPGAMNLAAMAYNNLQEQAGLATLTVKEFIKEVSSGNVESAPLVTELGRILAEKTLPLLDAAKQKYSAVLQNLNNQFTDFMLRMGEFYTAFISPLIEGLAILLSAFNDLIGRPDIFGKELEAASVAVGLLSDGTSSGAQNVKQMGDQVAAVSGKFDSFSSSTLTLVGSIGAASAAAGVFVTALKVGAINLMIAGIAKLSSALTTLAVFLVSARTAVITFVTAMSATAVGAFNMMVASMSAATVATGGLTGALVALRGAWMAFLLSGGPILITLAAIGTALVYGAMKLYEWATAADYADAKLMQLAKGAERNGIGAAKLAQEYAKLASTASNLKMDKAASDMQIYAQAQKESADRIAQVRKEIELLTKAKEDDVGVTIESNGKSTYVKSAEEIDAYIRVLQQRLTMEYDLGEAIRKATKPINEQVKANQSLAESVKAVADEQSKYNDLMDIQNETFKLQMTEREIALFDLRIKRERELQDLQKNGSHYDPADIAYFNGMTRAMEKATNQFWDMKEAQDAAKAGADAMRSALKKEADEMLSLAGKFEQAVDKMKAIAQKAQPSSANSVYIMDLYKIQNEARDFLKNKDFKSALKKIEEYDKQANAFLSQDNAKYYKTDISGIAENLASMAAAAQTELEKAGTEIKLMVAAEEAQVIDASAQAHAWAQAYLKDKSVGLDVAYNLMDMAKTADGSFAVPLQQVLSPERKKQIVEVEYVVIGDVPPGVD